MSRTIHFDTTNHQDWFFGASTDNDVIYGGAGDDVITGGIGNDRIDGGDASIRRYIRARSATTSSASSETRLS